VLYGLISTKSFGSAKRQHIDDRYCQLFLMISKLMIRSVELPPRHTSKLSYKYNSGDARCQASRAVVCHGNRTWCVDAQCTRAMRIEREAALLMQRNALRNASVRLQVSS
jgi:hypothetical protein